MGFITHPDAFDQPILITANPETTPRTGRFYYKLVEQLGQRHLPEADEREFIQRYIRRYLLSKVQELIGDGRLYQVRLHAHILERAPHSYETFGNDTSWRVFVGAADVLLLHADEVQPGEHLTQEAYDRDQPYGFHPVPLSKHLLVYQRDYPYNSAKAA